MGIFSRKTKETAPAAPAAAEKAVKKAPMEKAVKAPKTPKVAKTPKAAPVAKPAGERKPTATIPSNAIIIRPRITEKATVKADAENVYVFEVAQSANKTTVSQAIASLYKVTPVRVNITRNPSKKIFYRGKSGVTGGVKKAYVFVKKGEKIELV